MALTKLNQPAFGTGSVGSDQIEDGTIQNVEISGSLANAKLANSSITINGDSVSLGDSVSVVPFVEWQSVKTSSFTAVAGEGYFVDTTSSAITVTLPASPSLGDTVAIKDYAGTFGTNAVTIARNSSNIQGQAADSTLSTNRKQVVLVYSDSTKGWLYTQEADVADLRGPEFITATGGTVTTSGDYKIHVFTGDGTFCVSKTGNAPTFGPGGPQWVHYLVVAGGGSSGNGGYGTGGGGAGGFRESYSSPIAGPYTASPRATPTGIQIPASGAYPVTVGAGGAAYPGGGYGQNPGSPSAFSTITSAGGGGGGGYSFCQSSVLPNTSQGKNGGSGGGGGTHQGYGQSPVPGGTGNTPPVSPPQGSGGGDGDGNPCMVAGGGGGVLTSGSQGATSHSGGASGGQGATTSISGTSTTYGGGGGGGMAPGFSGQGQGGTGGSGGGGNGGGGPTDPAKTSAQAGSANTGGGGGGNRGDCGSKAGGKGIVIIRYKYQ